MTEYRNFWIRIENRADGLYVSSNSRASGAVSAPLVLPGDLDAYRLEALLKASSATRGASAGPRRDLILEGAEAPAGVSEREVGSELFRALLPGPVRDAFMRSAGSGKENGVRIRLQIDPNDPELAKLASLPWELIYNDVTRKALGRSMYTPVIRSLDVAQPYTMRPFAPPLRVLLVLANPSDTHPLDLDGEKRRVVEILEGLDGVEVTVIEHATERRIYDALDTGQYHALHYMGHGGFSDSRGGVLLLEDEHGRSAPLSAAELGDDLAERRAMRLVFLNACDTGRASHRAGADPFTGVASALVAAGIPAVVAMQVPVTDTAALAFSDKFYTMIAHGEPVDAAVAVGRRAIWRVDESSLEWATPVLFMRASDGFLFGKPPSGGEARPSAVAPAPATPAERPQAGRPRAERPPAERPPAAATPTTSIGQKVKTWGIGVLAGLGGLVVLAVAIGECSGDVEDPSMAADNSVEEAEMSDEAETPDEAETSDEARALVSNSGIAEYAADPVQLSVAQNLVDMRPDGIAGEMETILFLFENEPELIPLPVEPDRQYEVIGVCDDDCTGLYLELLQADGVTPLETQGDVTVDDGSEPRLRVTPTSADTYTLAVTLTDCSTVQCYVGVSVYEYALE
ncbi:CHAT domain-containing protein [Rubrivirga marina]|uniref:CHAT domain-containing protein n=1 Tax=Rubrivirga marina TaxID=1196024 RepID=A0A271IVK7_9BACT|nr:CHAT domain-containing protein [Rubrivirga marina]PAP75157.1 hypothetical protein BSZ37_01200 [Rubrivirga marina]